MKCIGAMQLLLLWAAVNHIDGCSRLLGRQFMSAVSRNAVRDVASNTAQQIVSQATSQVAANVAKKTAVETIKGIAKSIGKKSVETAGQAVVFGAVDAAGDAVRGSAQGDKASSQLVTIQDNQKALQLMQESQEQRKMQHQKEMKELQIRELQLSIPFKSNVVIEDISESEGKRDNHKVKQKDLPLEVKEQNADEPAKEELPQWAVFLAYIIGSFMAFLGFLFGYYCCRFSCKTSDDSNTFGQNRTRPNSRI